MSRRIVITSFGSYGDVYPYMGLALELQARGHRPVLAMPRYYQPLADAEGIAFHPVRPAIDPADREPLRQVMDARQGTEFIVREMILRPLRDTYADIAEACRGADLIVTHPITFAAVVLAQREGLPWVSTVLAPISFFSAHDVPVFPPAPWMKRLEAIPGAGKVMVSLARASTARWMEPLHAFRQELGLPRGTNPLFEGQHSPRAVIALFSRVLASPQPDWPPAVHVTGAVAYNGSTAAVVPENVKEFLAAGPPPVVFTLGTSAVGVAGRFYDTSVEAVRRLGCRAILLVGPYPENRPAVPLPPGVLVLEFVSHAALFPHAAAVVHQGGAGTMHQVLRAGVPSLVVPFAHDQPDHAHRLARMGTSRTIYPSRYTATRVVRALRALLDDPSYRSHAARIAAEVRTEHGASAACDVIEAVT